MRAASFTSLRPVGRSGVRVSALGFGAAAIGNLYAAIPDVQATQAVDAAFAAGIAYFDTAPHYGFGLSEQRLGAALMGHGDVVVSSKVGRLLKPVEGGDAREARHGFVGAAPFEPVFDYGYDAVMRSYEHSLRRLNRERIDILYAHDLGRLVHGDEHEARFAEFMDGGYRALRALRDQGLVGAIGLGVNEWGVCEEAMAQGDFDLFLLAGRYTLLEQTALDSFLPACAARGVSVVVGGPFNSGILVEGVGGAATPHYDYAPAPPAIIARVRQLQAVCAAHGVPLAAAAIQFPLAHPQVASVIPGMASAAQVADAVRWASFPIPPGLWRDLRTEGLLHPQAPIPDAKVAA